MNAKTKRRMVVVTGIIVVVLIVVLAVVGGNTSAKSVSIAEADVYKRQSASCATVWLCLLRQDGHCIQREVVAPNRQFPSSRTSALALSPNGIEIVTVLGSVRADSVEY